MTKTYIFEYVDNKGTTRTISIEGLSYTDAINKYKVLNLPGFVMFYEQD